MAQVKIMYWKEIPVQVKAAGGDGEISKPLDARFQEAVDAVAMMDGSFTTDEYLDSWQWGEPFESEGAVAEAVDRTVLIFNKGMPENFVSRIRDMHKSNKRDSTPGAIDHWLIGGRNEE